MYKVGDKVLYPMHGAGLIEGIEECEVMGTVHKYYTMHMPVGDMKVMIPCDGGNNAGLRAIVDEKTADEVIEFMSASIDEDAVSWNRRYRENMEKIKTGEIFHVAEVVKSLMVRDKEKGLSTGERKMLSDSRHILISELVLAKNSSKEKISAILDEKVFK